MITKTPPPPTPTKRTSYPIPPTNHQPNLQSNIKIEHNRMTLQHAKKFSYVEKWVTNKEIHSKFSNHFWNTQQTTNTQITQLLIYDLHNIWAIREQTYFGLPHTNPNCTLCHKNDQDTWPHLQSLCENKYWKGLRIPRHNTATHQITYLLKSCNHTRHCTLTNANNQQGKPHENTIPPWILKHTCQNTQCTCLSNLWPYIVYIQGAPHKQQGPIPHLLTFIIEFTFTHD